MTATTIHVCSLTKLEETVALTGARHLRASDVRRDADAAEIAASVLARVEKAAVCATTERSAA